MNNNTEIGEELLKDLYKEAFLLYTKEEKNVYEIKKILIEKGLLPETAEKIVKEVENTVEVEMREKGKKEVMLGIGLAALGCIITYTSYSNAVDSGGGKYLVTYGLVIAGVTAIIRGVYRLSQI